MSCSLNTGLPISSKDLFETKRVLQQKHSIFLMNMLKINSLSSKKQEFLWVYTSI